jgi:hypothetical protein
LNNTKMQYERLGGVFAGRHMICAGASRSRMPAIRTHVSVRYTEAVMTLTSLEHDKCVIALSASGDAGANAVLGGGFLGVFERELL